MAPTHDATTQDLLDGITKEGPLSRDHLQTLLARAGRLPSGSSDLSVAQVRLMGAAKSRGDLYRDQAAKLFVDAVEQGTLGSHLTGIFEYILTGTVPKG